MLVLEVDNDYSGGSNNEAEVFSKMREFLYTFACKIVPNNEFFSKWSILDLVIRVAHCSPNAQIGITSSALKANYLFFQNVPLESVLLF